jgi:hypothetical protein
MQWRKDRERRNMLARSRLIAIFRKVEAETLSLFEELENEEKGS